MPFDVLVFGAPLERTDLLLVLLHGRAVPGNDLENLAEGILRHVSDRGACAATVVLPQGPLAEGLGRSWWEMPAHMDTGSGDMWRPPAALVWDLAATVKDAAARCPRQPALVLGGFSQGAVLATHGLAALGSEGVGAVGLVVLSGFLDVGALGEAAQYMPVSIRGALRIFLAHGHADPVIPEAVAHAMVEMAESAQLDGARGVVIEKHLHGGGHEVGDGTLEGIARWLGDIIDAVPQDRAVDSSLAAPQGGGRQRKRQGFSAMLAQRAAEEGGPGAAGGESVLVTSETLADGGGDEDGPFRPGDVVQLKGLADLPRLNGVRAVLEDWDAGARRWEVEVVSTHERAFVPRGSLERHVSEGDRLQRRGAAALQQPVGPEQLEKLRGMEIDPVYDHPDLLNLVWGAAKATVPVGSEQAQLGGVPCVVFGRQANARAGMPTVLLFRGHSGTPGATFEDVASAYVAGLGAQVVVPFCARKLSECHASARAVTAALPLAFGPGPLLIHGMNSGSILATQVAAEHSHAASLPRAWLLVIENGVPALGWIPKVQGMLGCISADPLGQEYKLRLARCPVVLVRGFEGDVPPSAPKEPMDILAGACVTAPSMVREASAIQGTGELREEVRAAAESALFHAKESGAHWAVEAPSCLAREAASLKSAEVGRFQCGAVLRQLDQQGLRLHVQRLEGKGPDQGWVSFAVSGKSPLRPYDVSGGQLGC